MTDFDSLRSEIIKLGESTVHAMDAQNRLADLHGKQINALWADNAELRDELHALANRVEALTRALTTAPAEVAEAMVRYADGTMKCPLCGGAGGFLSLKEDGVTVECANCKGFGRVRGEKRVIGRRHT